MRETLEFRVAERQAAAILGPGVGKVDGWVRKIEVSPDDPLVEQLREADAEARSRGGALLLGWEVRRSYSEEELQSATLFRLTIGPTFEPTGEECGTVYDLASTCPVCGAGRRQVSPLALDSRRIPRKADLARTIAGDEWIASKRLVAAFEAAEVTGVEFGEVRQCHTTEAVLPSWRQLHVVSPPVGVAEATRTGVHPLQPDVEGRYECPLGHTRGLNLISELYVLGGDWNGADVFLTREFSGSGAGCLSRGRF